MNRYNKGFTYNVGDKIKGAYHDVSYSGTVRVARRHTVKHDLTELTIDLDKPIEVYGTDRQSIIVSILDNGQEV